MPSSAREDVDPIPVELQVELGAQDLVPDAKCVQELAARAIEAIAPGELQAALREAWADKRLLARHELHATPEDLPLFRVLDGTSLDLGKRRANGVLGVSGADQPGPRRPGLWGCVVIAQALAAATGGKIVDPNRKGMGGVAVEELLVRSDARVHVGRHICVPACAGPGRGTWLTTLGLRKFGVPELEMCAVQSKHVESAARLMAGVGQVLVDSDGPSLLSGRVPAALTVTLRELQWALGLRPTASTTGAKQWTRIGLRSRRVLPRCAPRIELLPAPGYRGSRRDWLSFALADLVGPPRRAAQERMANATKKSA